MKIQRKKTPNDYPQMTFRLSNEDELQRVDALIEKIKNAYNAKRKEGEKMVRRNDVILDALERGLKAMNKGLGR